MQNYTFQGTLRHLHSFVHTHKVSLLAEITLQALLNILLRYPVSRENNEMTQFSPFNGDNTLIFAFSLTLFNPLQVAFLDKNSLNPTSGTRIEEKDEWLLQPYTPAGLAGLIFSSSCSNYANGDVAIIRFLKKLAKAQRCRVASNVSPSGIFKSQELVELAALRTISSYIANIKWKREERQRRERGITLIYKKAISLKKHFGKQFWNRFVQP